MRWRRGSQNITFEVRALENLIELLVNKFRGDIDLFLVNIGDVKKNIFKQSGEHRVEPARSDILHLAIDLDESNESLAPIKARIAHMAVVDILAIGLAVRCKPAYLEQLRKANLSLTDKFETRPRKA